MLPRKNRFNLKRDYKGGFKVVLNTAALLVKYRRDEPLKGAIIVPKTAAPKAVDRNRIKRIVLESLNSSGVKGSFIFIVKENIKDYKKEEINEILEQVKRKLRT